MALLALCWAAFSIGPAAAADSAEPAQLPYLVGVASVDITPDYPVRLSGYASRKSDSEGVAQRIHAKALVVGARGQKPAVLVTADNCGVPGAIRNELARRLAPKGIEDDRLTVCSTHTHSAPWLNGYLPNLFLVPLTPEEQERRDRYTREFTDALERVVLRALADRQPSAILHGKGRATFAANRRTPGGPVDHDLPVLFVTGAGGSLRATLAGYACHCTTLTGEFNQICGDWAGYAQEDIQKAYPGNIALIAIGCGGDANPDPRPGWDLARQHGAKIAREVSRLWSESPKPVKGQIDCTSALLDLAFDTLPTREEWETRAARQDYAASHARLNLARLDRGEAIPRTLSYRVQTWSWGTDLGMVFLPGEVVVDYSLRLKRELDGAKVWVMAYANDVPCYIPSERVLKEGGYEGGGAMVYYDQPTRLAPGLEESIVRAVHRLFGGRFDIPNR